MWGRMSNLMQGRAEGTEEGAASPVRRQQIVMEGGGGVYMLSNLFKPVEDSLIV